MTKTFDDIPGFVIVATVSLVMTVLGVSVLSDVPVEAFGRGICIPEPQMWVRSPFLSWLLNVTLIGVAAMATVSLNIEYNLAPGTQSAPAWFFMLATCSIMPLGRGLNAGIVMTLVAIICWRHLFEARKRENTSRDLFWTSSVLSLCSMFDYAFMLALMPLMFGAAALRMLNVKSAVAALMGVAAPYIIAAALSTVTDLRLVAPSMVNPFSNPILLNAAKPAIVAAVLAIAGGIVLLVREAISFPETGSEEAALNQVINLWFICFAFFSVVNHSNFLCYLPVINLCVGFRVGTMLGSREYGYKATTLVCIVALYLFIFLLGFIV